MIWILWGNAQRIVIVAKPGYQNAKFQVSSKSLLANVLDMDDNFCGGTIVTSSVKGLHANNNHCGSLVGNGIYPRYD